jgi:thioredoxin 1
MQPIYEELARYYKGLAKFFWVDADQEKELFAQYGIKEVPTILFFKNNELIDYAPGLVSKNKLIAKIENAL